MLKSVSQHIMRRIERRLHYLYGDRAPRLTNRLFMMVGRYGVGINGYHEAPANAPDESDIVLIAYGDMVRQEGESPLYSLRGFLADRLKDCVNTVHILPFFPYSSDDGFSVKDYRVVDPALGSWKDIESLSREFHLMFDLVINHVSRQSAWFRDYVSGVEPYRHYFIEVDPSTDLSQVVRPRSLPLLSETQTRAGKRHLWTTFSADQVDLDFANPEVLFEFLDILFWYISKGARIIRLDAIAYLWKVTGTPCIHLTQTHEIVKLLRDVVDMVAPHVLLITETNVPHEENISYFGHGDEAHMVYQFSLPPLLAYGLLTGNARELTQWASSLPEPGPRQTFLNFTASHDGVGVRPLQGLLSADDFQALIRHVEWVGGRVSYKRNADGTESPYELNITYFDLLADEAGRVTERQIARFLTSQAVMLAMRGVPAIYFNSLFGARNHVRGAQESGHHRTINREKWGRARLDTLLDDPTHHHPRVLAAYKQLLRTRRNHPAFHPDGAQRVLPLGDAVFGIERTAPDGSERIAALFNFSEHSVAINVDDRFTALPPAGPWKDVLTGQHHGGSAGRLEIEAYGHLWLTAVA